MKLQFQLLPLFFFLKSAAGQTCSGSNINFAAPSIDGEVKHCIDAEWERNTEYIYPDDFEDLRNEVSIYVCPTSDKRVILSNAIPDHSVTMSNTAVPCEVKWALELPLNPIVSNSRTEIPPRGAIAMAINGVPAYGPMESSADNAVEGSDGSRGNAGYWYGHADGNNRWHFHAPEMGIEAPSSDTLLGYAFDGFPIYGPLSDASVLDDCNGFTNSDGSYQYHVRTLDQVDNTLDYCNGDAVEVNWRYVLGCYSGDPRTYTSVNHQDEYTLPSDCVLEEDYNPDDNDENTCVDSELRMKILINGNKKNRYCTWVARKDTEERCAIDTVSSHCPITCANYGGDCSIDSEARTKFTKDDGTQVMRYCTWVANDPDVRCLYENAIETCRVTCASFSSSNAAKSNVFE